MPRSSPPIPFLKDLAFPQPASTPGTRLARKLGTSRTSGSSNSSLLGYVLFAIFIIPILMLGAMVLAVSIIAVPIALLVPKSRRRVIGWLMGRRQPIEIEVSKDPLVPGDTFEGMLVFRKSRPLDHVRITLQCVEEAKYRRGTSTYTDRHTAYEHILVDMSNPATDQLRFVGQIPPDAMHTFTSSSNTIDWRLKIDRTFPGDNIDEKLYLLDVYTVELEQAIIQYRLKNPSLTTPLHASHGGAR